MHTHSIHGYMRNLISAAACARHRKSLPSGASPRFPLYLSTAPFANPPLAEIYAAVATGVSLFLSLPFAGRSRHLRIPGAVIPQSCTSSKKLLDYIPFLDLGLPATSGTQMYISSLRGKRGFKNGCEGTHQRRRRENFKDC